MPAPIAPADDNATVQRGGPHSPLPPLEPSQPDAAAVDERHDSRKGRRAHKKLARGCHIAEDSDDDESRPSMRPARGSSVFLLDPTVLGAAQKRKLASPISPAKSQSFNHIEVEMRDRRQASARWRPSSAYRRAEYVLNQYLKQGGRAKLLAVLVLLLLQIIGGAIILHQAQRFQCRHGEVNDDEAAVCEYSLETGLWDAWTFALDPGTHADVTGTAPRAVAAVVTWVGLIFVGMLFGFIVENVKRKLAALEQGTCDVVERGHHLVLGWTDKAPFVIGELSVAMADTGGGTVVIMCDAERQDVETEIARGRRRGHILPSTTTIFRRKRGSFLTVSELDHVSASHAVCVVILSSPGPSDESDASTLRTVLTLKSMSTHSDLEGGGGSGYAGHVVAEVSDIDNRPLIEAVGGSLVETVVSHDIVGRMLIKCRQPQLSLVYTEILGQAGCEIYFSKWPELAGLTFEAACARFDTAVLVGLRRDDATILNPTQGIVIKADDHLIVLAEDDTTYSPSPAGPSPTMRPPPAHTAPRSTPEVLLIVNWRRDFKETLDFLDDELPHGSTVHVFGTTPLDVRERQLEEVGDIDHIVVHHHVGNPAVRRDMRKLTVRLLRSVTSVLILSTEEYENKQFRSDSHTLASLLNVIDRLDRARAAATTSGNNATPLPPLQSATPPSVICEILDSRTRATIRENQSISSLSEFLIANELSSRMLAAVSHERKRGRVLSELLGPEGNELYLRPPTKYLHADELGGEATLTFFGVAARARTFNEIVIGYMCDTTNLGVTFQGDDWWATEKRSRDKSMRVLAGVDPGDVATRKQKRPSLRAQASGRLKAVLARLAASDEVVDVVLAAYKTGGITADGWVPVLNPPGKDRPRVWHREAQLIVVAAE